MRRTWKEKQRWQPGSFASTHPYLGLVVRLGFGPTGAPVWRPAPRPRVRPVCFESPVDGDRAIFSSSAAVGSSMFSSLKQTQLGARSGRTAAHSFPHELPNRQTHRYSGIVRWFLQWHRRGVSWRQRRQRLTAAQPGAFNTAWSDFTAAIRATVPFDVLATALNVFRVNVASVDSGADDPVAAGGTGAVVGTYVAASFGSNNIRRLQPWFRTPCALLGLPWGRRCRRAGFRLEG